MLGLFQLADMCDDLVVPIAIVKGILGIIQFAIPVLLIIMGTIDLGKAVMSSDEKEIKGAVSKLTKRAIAAVAVFIVAALIVMVMNMVSDAAKKDTKAGDPGNFVTCWTKTENGGSGGSGAKACAGPAPTCHTSGIPVSCDTTTGSWGDPGSC